MAMLTNGIDRADPRPIRIAVLGTGWVSRTVWLPLLAAHPDVIISAVADTDRTAARAAAGYQHTRLLDDIGEVDAEVADLAIIALPNHQHVPTATRLLRKGMSVFVEKPVCQTATEAHELAAACRASAMPGGRVFGWSAARHRGDVERLKALVPTLGPLRRADLSWTRAAGIPQRAGWFTDRRLAGGGALLDLGWHLLDVGLDLLGWPDVVSGVGTLSFDWMENPDAVADWRSDRGHSGPVAQDPVEDTAEGYLVTEGGMGIRIETRWASHAAFDSTTLTIEGVDGVASLNTTFGFSPHRRGGSSLTVIRRGKKQTLSLPPEPVGIEYERQVDTLARILVGSAAAERAAGLGPDGSMTSILRIATATALLYKSATVAATTGRSER